MSAPGTPGRRLEWVEGPVDQIVAKAVELVGTVPDARSFELRYEAADRVLADGEEPHPDEAVAWHASAELRRKYAKGTKPVVRTITGTSIVAAHGNHAEGIVRAVVDLLEQLGANVVLMFGGPE